MFLSVNTITITFNLVNVDLVIAVRLVLRLTYGRVNISNVKSYISYIQYNAMKCSSEVDRVLDDLLSCQDCTQIPLLFSSLCSDIFQKK